MTDVMGMDSVTGIAQMSTLLSQAQARVEAATKVDKIARGQEQVVADMVTAALEDVQEMVTSMTGDPGTQIDTYA